MVGRPDSSDDEEAIEEYECTHDQKLSDHSDLESVQSHSDAQEDNEQVIMKDEEITVQRESHQKHVDPTSQESDVDLGRNEVDRDGRKGQFENN